MYGAKMRRLQNTVILLQLLLLAACSALPAQSVVAPGYTGTPERTLVSTRLGGARLPADQHAAFPPAIVAALASCGVVAEVIDLEERTLEYGTNHAGRTAAAMSRLRADTRLAVILRSYTLAPPPGRNLNYEAVLSEVPTNRVVWRGTFTVLPDHSQIFGTENGGQALAKLIAERMSRDNVLRGCPARASR
jgi:hypothetical protein